MRALVVAAVFALGLAGGGSAAHASCACRCVNGAMQALCTGNDYPAVCPYGNCPLAPADYAPYGNYTPTLFGTTRCSQQQVMNPLNKLSSWHTVCQ